MPRRPKIPPRLHELEAEVMEAVWTLGETTVRDVMERLNRGNRNPRAYTTYMTVMSRLAEKGMLKRRRVGKTDIYIPRQSREQYREQRAQAEVGALVDEFGDVALAQFARRVAGLDRKRLAELERLADGG
jgi:BlaI family transcriptional regulator, penicillinase repressor